MELQILDWIQQMRTPVGDIWMVFISRLGNAGMIWILFTCLLLMIPLSPAYMIRLLVKTWLTLLQWLVWHLLTHSWVFDTLWLTSSVRSTTCPTVSQTLC